MEHKQRERDGAFPPSPYSTALLVGTVVAAVAARCQTTISLSRGFNWGSTAQIESLRITANQRMNNSRDSKLQLPSPGKGAGAPCRPARLIGPVGSVLQEHPDWV